MIDKYLVVRRDGTTPRWPYFVLGAKDIASVEALRTYARIASLHHYDDSYVQDVVARADAFNAYRLEHGESVADTFNSRNDVPMIIRAIETRPALITISTVNTLINAN